MRPPSTPEIYRTDPNKYYIGWNHDVPYPLWDKYPRKRIRIKVYDIDNRLKGKAREEQAAAALQQWKYKLEVLKYNPFEAELVKLAEVGQRKLTVKERAEAEQQKEAQLSEEEKRKLTPLPVAFEKFMQSRRDRKLEPETISAYQGLVDWVYEGLCSMEYDNFTIGQLRHIHLSDALNYIAEDREWVATTINKGVEFLMTMFNWFETEEYVVKNPSKNKFIKLPTNKTKNRWYDKDLARAVKKATLAAGADKVYRAMQFTYMLLIRSKKELRKLRIGDIDQDLKRIRFSAELSKTSAEQYRDYPDEFQAVIDEMKLSNYPKEYFVFGSKDGNPGPVMCGHNYFSKIFKPIKDGLGLSMDYSIYGWKHTRIVHELMKRTDGYEISYMARHDDPKSTKEYQRDYDITLVNVYGPEDLKF